MMTTTRTMGDDDSDNDDADNYASITKTRAK